MAVVVIDKHGQRPFEMWRVHDQHSIKTFGSDRSDKPFRDPVGLRRLNWRANDSCPLSLEDRIEAARELAIVIANQEANRPFALGELPRQLSRLLRHPLPVGMRRAFYVRVRRVGGTVGRRARGFVLVAMLTYQPRGVSPLPPGSWRW